MTVTATITDDSFAEWFEHPLVRKARLRLAQPPSAVDLLTKLHEILTELDERFPGVPFRTILGGAPDPISTVRAALKRAGVAPSDIELIAPAQADQVERPHRLTTFRRMLADEVAAGDSLREVARRHQVSPGTVRRAVRAAEVYANQ